MSHMTNPLATAEQLYRRSSLAALPPDLQDTIFFATQCLTQAAGLLLRLPQSVTAQANVILARYWLVESPLHSEFSVSALAIIFFVSCFVPRVSVSAGSLTVRLWAQDVSAATLFLVAKLSSHPTPPRDICNVYAYLLSPASPLFCSAAARPPPTPDPTTYFLSEPGYGAFHTRILALESAVLSALAFDTHVALPHALAITYLQALDFLSHPKSRISQRVVEYLNTALLSPQLLYLTHQPNALAVAAIYNAARDLGAKMPECAWWEVFDVEREELGFLVVAMRSLEGMAIKMKEETEELQQGRMVTKGGIGKELRKRGLAPAASAAGMSEEEAMMRSLDERAAQMEED